MKKSNFALTSLLLLALATSACKTSLKISSPTAAETQRLYSEGAYQEQVQRAIASH